MRRISKAHLVDTPPASVLVADQHLPDISVSTLVADLLGRIGLANCICYVRGRGWYRRNPSGGWERDERVPLDLQCWIKGLLRGRMVDLDSWEVRIGQFVARGTYNAKRVRKQLASFSLFDQVFRAAQRDLTRPLAEVDPEYAAYRKARLQIQ